MNYRKSLLQSCSAFVFVTLTSGPVCAVDLDKHLGNRNAPALLIATEVHYDDQKAIATAKGNVEVIQDNTILRADEVVYDVNADKVTAAGHVSILQPSGDVFFADNASLTRKMQEGVVKNFKARLKDNSLFVARQGNKIDKNITKLDHLIFSPCKVCKPAAGKEAKAPLWQIQARKATVDEEAKRISYRDAFFDVYGVPIMYTPYFSHATPDAPSQSGLLTPQFFHSTDLGNVIKLPVFVSIAPNMDMTLTPWKIGNEKPLLAAEFRSLFEHGDLRINGAFTDTYNRNTAGNIVPGTQSRGYIEGHGLYHLNQDWTVGLDAERTTDDTFLQRYRFGWKDVLTSRVYADRIHDRDYASIEALSFQGLTTLDNAKVSPTILPQITYHLESTPMAAHSRATLDSSLLVAQQDDGVSTRRLSTTAGWKLPYITPGGQVFEAATTLRGDVYDISDQTVDTTTGASYSGTLARAIPQFDLNWRYPFINHFSEERSLMIAPVAELTASPHLHLSSKFPNEDSQVTELSDINIFSPDRFTGLDRMETGTRFTYGTRGHFQNRDDQWLEWLLGQTYRENSTNAFPITNSTNPHYSDYIGRLGLKYKWVDITYSFRLNRDNFSPISNNVNTMLLWNPVSLEATYVSLRHDPTFGNRQEVFGNAFWDITPTWRLGFNGRRDLGSSTPYNVPTTTPYVITNTNLLQPSPGTVGLGASLVFHNECISVTGGVSRNYINQQDVRPSTTYAVIITFNKLGGKPPTTTSSSSGAGNVGATVTTSSPLNDAGTENDIRSTP